MSKDNIDGIILKAMMRAGAIVLKNNKADVDSLNVFPVPDGDTGTNMSLTMTAAVKELEKIQENSAAMVARHLSMGSLMGARGNSGVILSQLFRGFAKGVGERATLSTEQFAAALQQGVTTAYKAVIKPVEGTMLTVSREAARRAAAAAGGCDFIALIEELLVAAQEALKKTPFQLPILAQAGVVDAGGKGLCYIYEGWLRSLKGEQLDDTSVSLAETAAIRGPAALTEESIEFQYCTEFMVKGNGLSELKIRDALMELENDSLLAVGDENLVKVHVHSNHPGKILEICLQFGELSNLKIDNMKEQHNEILIQKEASPPLATGKTGVVAVAVGKGIKDVLRSLGCTTIIEGGQTMNPSTEAILAEIEKQPTDNVIILPNNKNIILAAKQAAKLSNKKAYVLPTKSIPQGISAMLNFNAETEDIEGMMKSMAETARQVKTGQVTTAVRESRYNGWEIKAGDFLGMFDGDLVVIDSDREALFLKLLEKMIDENSEIITVFAGDVSEEEFEQVQTAVSETYPDLECEFYRGGQPVYAYIISVE